MKESSIVSSLVTGDCTDDDGGDTAENVGREFFEASRSSCRPWCLICSSVPRERTSLELHLLWYFAAGQWGDRIMSEGNCTVTPMTGGLGLGSIVICGRHSKVLCHCHLFGFPCSLWGIRLALLCVQFWSPVKSSNPTSTGFPLCWCLFDLADWNRFRFK